MQITDSAQPDDGPRVWRTPEAIHIDVRGLDPPQPMLAILQLIHQAGGEGVVIAHLDREPIFLYPELSDRGWSYEVVSPSAGESRFEGEVSLRVFR